MRRLATLAAVIFFLSLCAGAWAQTAGGDRPIVVVFRYDDYGDPDAAAVEGRIIDAFKTQGLTITFAAIPFGASAGPIYAPSASEPMPPERVEVLKRAIEDGAVEMAQHGYNHEALKRGIVSRFGTEFRTIDPAIQEQKIADGQAFLEKQTGHKVTLFIPPFNSYDENTLRLLEKHGFTMISAGLGGAVVVDSKLQRLPATCNVEEVQQVVELARKTTHGKPCVIVALMHSYDFIEYDQKQGKIRFEDLDQSLRWVVAQKDVRVLSIGQACKALGNLGPDRLAANERIYELSFHVPVILKDRFPSTIYFETNAIDGVIAKWMAILWAFYVGLGIVSGAVTLIVAAYTFSRFRWVRWGLTITATVLLAVTIVLGVPNMFSSARSMLSVSICLGMFAASWIWWLRTRPGAPGGEKAGA